MNQHTKSNVVFNYFFSNAVKNLNIDYYKHLSFDKSFLCKNTENKDRILCAIKKYEGHPRILKIRSTTLKNSHFSFAPTDLKSVVTEIGNLSESKSALIESIPATILKGNYNIICHTIDIDFNFLVNNGIFPRTRNLQTYPLFSRRMLSS